MIFNFDAPDTKAGYCPECSNKADIWDDRRRVWECTMCNWSGKMPKYEIHEVDRDRLAYLEGMR